MVQMKMYELTAERVSAGDFAVDLVTAETSVQIGLPGFGWGFSYTRPVRVESDRGVVPIRDHVMIVRMGAIAVALLLAVRRFMS